MRVPPAEVVASFPKGDPENPQRMGPALVIVNALFMGITALAVAMRIYVRAAMKRQLGMDDVFIGIALVWSQDKLRHRNTSILTWSSSSLSPWA